MDWLSAVAMPAVFAPASVQYGLGCSPHRGGLTASFFYDRSRLQPNILGHSRRAAHQLREQSRPRSGASRPIGLNCVPRVQLRGEAPAAACAASPVKRISSLVGPRALKLASSRYPERRIATGHQLPSKSGLHQSQSWPWPFSKGLGPFLFSGPSFRSAPRWIEVEARSTRGPPISGRVGRLR